MSVTKQIIETKRAGKKSSQSGSVAGARFFTYKPDDAHKQAIKSGYSDIDACLKVLERFVLQGSSITLGGKEGSDNVFCLIREKTADWTTSRCVSVWHVSLDRAIAGLAFYLEEVNSDFPEGTGIIEQASFDW